MNYSQGRSTISNDKIFKMKTFSEKLDVGTRLWLMNSVEISLKISTYLSEYKNRQLYFPMVKKINNTGFLAGLN